MLFSSCATVDTGVIAERNEVAEEAAPASAAIVTVEVEPVKEEVIPAEAAVEVVVAESAEPAPAEEVVPSDEVAGKLTYKGFEAAVLLGETAGTISYDSSFFTEADIKEFINAVAPKYGSYLAEVYYSFPESGVLAIAYPSITEDFRASAIAALNSELNSYVPASLLPAESAPAVAAETPVETVEAPKEEVAPETVAPEPVEEAAVVEEAPAIEAPAAEPAVAETPVEAPAEEPKSVVEEAKVVEEKAPVAEAAPKTESKPAPDAAPVVTEVEQTKEVVALDSSMSVDYMLFLGIFVVIVVIFTACIAIRNANKSALSKGFSLILSVIFTALSMVVSTIVSGWTVFNLLYLVILFTYFIFRSKGKNQPQ